jgi:signal transduction histidine kinase
VITELQGLPDDTLSQVLEDNFGLLWFGASRGLFKLRRPEVIDFIEGRSARITPIVFGKSDGLAGFSAAANYQPSAWKARNGQLWFATRKGLVSTVPERQQPDERGPHVYLDSVVADGRPLERDSTSLPSSIKKLEFRYTAPIYISADKAHFRHRLEGFESDWVEAGELRVATYPRLTPGHYVFRVMAGNRDLVWSPTGASFAFDVLPAWWETRAAWISALVLGAVGLAAMVRHWSQRRLRQRLAELESRRRLELERARIARDLHDSLGASLTQAGMLAEELSEDCLGIDEMRETSGELANRVRLIARDLDAAVWAVSPKNDTLASLCAYLCQFFIEFFRDTPTRCRVHTSDDIPAVDLTPEVRHHLFLTAREAANNILKHAAAHEVQLTMRTRDSAFEMCIEDDGRGFDVASAATLERHGLRNMRARLAEIGGAIDIESEPGHTVVRISMPLSAAAPKDPMPAGIP